MRTIFGLSDSAFALGGGSAAKTVAVAAQRAPSKKAKQECMPDAIAAIDAKSTATPRQVRGAKTAYLAVGFPASFQPFMPAGK